MPTHRDSGMRRKLSKRARKVGGGTHIPAACPSKKRAWTDRHSAELARRGAVARFHGTYRIYICQRLPRGVSGQPCGQYHLTSIK